MYLLSLYSRLIQLMLGVRSSMKPKLFFLLENGKKINMYDELENCCCVHLGFVRSEEAGQVGVMN